MYLLSIDEVLFRVWLVLNEDLLRLKLLGITIV